MDAVLGARRATPRRLLRWLLLAIVGVAFAVSLHELPSIWPMSPYRVALKLTIWHGLFALVPIAALLAARLPRLVRQRRGGALATTLLALAGIALALWGRYVEPRQLRVVQTPLSQTCGVRVALVSDIHLGIYARGEQLDALIARLNALDVDAVLVAGDWTYEPPRDLAAAFAPWGRLRHRSIGVLGNHDEQQPGPPLQRPLRAALQAQGLQWAEGRRLELGRCELVGLGDHNARSDRRDLAALQAQPSAVEPARRIVLAHNPDSMSLLPKDFAAWTLAGHTHGGQINLPLLTPVLLGERTEHELKRGPYTLPEGRVFVTSGTGMTKVPLRVRMPPTIDVLEL